MSYNQTCQNVEQFVFVSGLGSSSNLGDGWQIHYHCVDFLFSVSVLTRKEDNFLAILSLG